MNVVHIYVQYFSQCQASLNFAILDLRTIVNDLCYVFSVLEHRPYKTYLRKSERRFTRMEYVQQSFLKTTIS